MSIIAENARLFGFPEEAVLHFDDCFSKLVAVPGALDRLYEAQELLFLKEGKDFVAALAPVYEKTDINPYSVDMVFLLMAATPLKYIYAARGYSFELYVETMRDLLFKLRECVDVKGVFGTFVIEWYQKFYTCERFKLGRLQFETRAYPCDEPFRDMFKKGDAVVGCHIPSDGSLKYEDVIASLKMAYDFYPHMRKNGILPIYCHSWLMYPPYAGEVFPKGTNLYRFLKLFELVRSEVDEDYTDFFRIYSKDFCATELDSLPEDTSLRRNMKKFLADGNKMGTSFGFILFDGEKVITEQK